MTARVLFLGRKPIGERCFSRLRAKGSVRLAAAVSNTTTGGAYDWWGTASIHRDCARDGVPFVASEQRNEAAIAALIREHHIDTIVCVQHPWILSGSLLSLVGHRAFNLHLARLPDYKGYNSISHAILAGDPTYTATVHWMADDVDAGDIAFEVSVDVAAHDTARSLYDRAAAAGEAAFDRVVDCLARGADIPRTPLRGPGRFYPRDSLDSLRQIRDPSDPIEVDRKARAMYFPPFEPAYVVAGGARYHVLPAQAWAGSGR